MVSALLVADASLSAAPLRGRVMPSGKVLAEEPMGEAGRLLCTRLVLGMCVTTPGCSQYVVKGSVNGGRRHVCSATRSAGPVAFSFSRSVAHLCGFVLSVSAAGAGVIFIS